MGVLEAPQRDSGLRLGRKKEFDALYSTAVGKSLVVTILIILKYTWFTVARSKFSTD